MKNQLHQHCKYLKDMELAWQSPFNNRNLLDKLSNLLLQLIELFIHIFHLGKDNL
jgi:hypothetical protein